MSHTNFKSHYCHGIKGIKVGFVFSYPHSKSRNEGKPLSGMAAVNLNNLLCKLNKNYPSLFPYCNWNSYRITNSYTQTNNNNFKTLTDLKLISQADNIARIMDEINGIQLVICFGEKAYFAVKKTTDKYKLNYHVIKVGDLNNSNISRSIHLLNKKNKPRIRTNFRVLELYQNIVNEINNIR